MNFELSVNLDGDQLEAAIKFDPRELTSYAANISDTSYCFYLLRDGYVEVRDSYKTIDNKNWLLEHEGRYTVQAFLKVGNKKFIKFSEPLAFFEDDAEAKFSSIPDVDLEDLDVNVFEASYPYEDFVLTNLDLSDSRSLHGFHSNHRNKCYLYTKLTNMESHEVLFSGVGITDKKLIYGQDDVKNIKDIKVLSESIGCFTAISFNHSDIHFFTDLYGIGKIFYYNENGKFLVSNNYHLLLLCLQDANIKLSLFTNKVKSLLMSNRQPLLHQNFSVKMDVEKVLMKHPESCLEVKDGSLSLSNGDLSSILVNSEEYTDDNYKQLLYKAAEEIKANIQTILESDKFDNLIFDLTGGVDSRIVYAALSNFPQYKDKIFINSNHVDGLDDLNVALKLNSLYQFKYDSLPRSSIEIPGRVGALQASCQLGRYYSYGKSPVFKEQLSRTARVTGNIGDLYRNYLSAPFIEESSESSLDEFIEHYTDSIKHQLFFGSNHPSFKEFKLRWFN